MHKTVKKIKPKETQTVPTINDLIWGLLPVAAALARSLVQSSKKTDQLLFCPHCGKKFTPKLVSLPRPLKRSLPRHRAARRADRRR
jgi:hypothetical protein